MNIKRTPEKDKEIVDKLIEWFEEYNCYDGETLCQDDECLTEAPYLLAEILDDYLNKD